MGVEIERKFLVRNDSWLAGVTGTRIRQGYLCVDPERVVRIRAMADKAWVTIKGKISARTRHEFEWPIPVKEARHLLEDLCLKPIIDKTRYSVQAGRHTWEIDVFHGQNQGLVVAEVELGSETERVHVPEWAGKEVTGDERYLNVNLVQLPFRLWKATPRAPSGPGKETT